MEKLGGGVKWLFRRIETHTRQRNPAGVKCELLRARLWTMMMNRSQGDHGVMLSGHSLMGAWCLQGRREMVGLSQEEGGRCQGVEWKLSQTGVMEREREGKWTQDRGLASTQLPGQTPAPAEAPGKPITVTVEEQRSQSVRPGADVTFICTAKSKVGGAGSGHW